MDIEKEDMQRVSGVTEENRDNTFGLTFCKRQLQSEIKYLKRVILQVHIEELTGAMVIDKRKQNIVERKTETSCFLNKK